MKQKLAVSIALATALAAAAPVSAQKSQDTLRIAINDMFAGVDPYHYTSDEHGNFYRAVYASLIEYDERKKVFLPSLAKSFKRLDKMTLEFELRDDIKFHNGNPFDATDVKATFDYIGGPELKVRFTSRFDWVKETEILGPYKIRLHANRLNATDLMNIANHMKIVDGETLSGLENKADYGRLAPMGTGAYRLLFVDRNKGVLVERVDGFHGDKRYFRAPVKRVHGLPMPDRQTQKAQLLTGGVDLLRNVTADDAQSLAELPDLAVSYTASGQLLYVTLDAVGRSANKAMTDERVRKAFIMAIDREHLVKNVVPGGSSAEIPGGLCLKSTGNCVPTTKPYAYDPAQAKRLLLEAGYPNGFDLTIDVYQPFAYFAEALAGELRKVGIRASVQPLTLAVYTKKRGAGELTAFLGSYPTSALPMMSNIMDVFFGDNRDYYGDPLILKALEDGAVEYDSGARDRMYGPALDRINEKAYILPISDLPMAWVHSKQVRILPNPLSPLTSRVGDFAWSDYKE